MNAGRNSFLVPPAHQTTEGEQEGTAVVAAAETQTRIPWYGWVGLAVFITAGLLIAVFTNRPVVPDVIRWIVTLAWVAVTVGLGLYDFFGGAASGGGQGIDDRPIDRWSIPHGGAGLVFGVWFIPLVFVVPLVILWEVFESLPTGFGQGEIFTNRLCDIGLALAGWLLVTVIAAAASGAPIPWV